MAKKQNPLRRQAYQSPSPQKSPARQQPQPSSSYRVLNKERALDIATAAGSLTTVVSIIADIASVIQGTRADPSFFTILGLIVILITFSIRAFTPPHPLWAQAGTILIPVLASLSIGLLRLKDLQTDWQTYLLLSIAVALATIGTVLSRRRKGLHKSAAYIYSPLVRNTAIGIMYATIAISLITLSYTFYFLSTTPDKTLVLVADFDSGSNTTDSYGISEIIRSEMRNKLSSFTDFQVRNFGRVIREADGSDVARKEGLNQKATIVVWGWYRGPKDKIYIETHFELLRRAGPTIIASCRFTQEKPVSDFFTLSFQGELSNQLTALSLMTSGAAHYAEGDWDAAIQRFEDALQYDTGYNNDISKWLAIAYYQRAYNKFKSDDELPNFIPDFSRAIELNPSFISAYHLRGAAYLIQGNNSAALKDINFALEKEPTACSYHNRSIIYSNIGMYDNAIKDSNRAIEIAPNEPSYHDGLGGVYYRKGEYKQAIQNYTRAIELDQSNANYWYNRGLSYRYDDQLLEAKQDFETALKKVQDPELRKKIEEELQK